MEMLDSYADVVDKVRADYQRALAAGCKARLIQVCRPDWTLHAVYRYGFDYAQSQYESECDLYEHIPFRSVICKVTGLKSDDLNVYRFLDHVTYPLVDRITMALHNNTLRDLRISFMNADSHWPYPTFQDVINSLDDEEEITYVDTLGTGVYTISVRGHLESDEMGDWYYERYIMLNTKGGHFYG
jgi:hypothetical protein